MSFNRKAKRCSICLMPETSEHIVLDKNGICNVCEHENVENIKGSKKISFNEIDVQQKTDLLYKKIEKYRNIGKYDCAVSVSGGKDSIMTLYIAKEILKLNPLAIFIDNGFAVEEMYENVKNATDILKTDLIIYKTADLFDLYKIFLESKKKIYYCRTCHALIDYYIRNICRQNKINLVLGGYTKGQQYVKNFELSWIYKESDKNVVELLKNHPRFSDKVGLFENQFTFFNNEFPDIVLISPFKYLNWNEEEIIELISSKLKFKLPKKSWPKNSTNCLFNFVSQVMAEKQFGYAQHEVELSNLVRIGEITREKALQIIESPIEEEDLSYALNKMGISISAICDWEG